MYDQQWWCTRMQSVFKTTNPEEWLSTAAHYMFTFGDG
jgi:hypothetical protein